MGGNAVVNPLYLLHYHKEMNELSVDAQLDLGHVFQEFKESKDKRQFSKTLEALEHYANKNLSRPADLVMFSKKHEEPQTVEPPSLTTDELRDKSKAPV